MQLSCLHLADAGMTVQVSKSMCMLGEMNCARKVPPHAGVHCAQAPFCSIGVTPGMKWWAAAALMPCQSRL